MLYELSADVPIRWQGLFELRKKVEGLGVQSVESNIEAVIAELTEFFEADSGAVVFAGRTEHEKGDPLKGWRAVWFHREMPRPVAIAVNAAIRRLKWGKKEAEMLGERGRHRAGSMSFSDHDSPTHAWLARLVGIEHRLGATLPIGQRLEVHFLLDRKRSQGRFREDADGHALAAMHVFEPIARRWCRMLGLLDGDLLRRRERDVLVCLLQGLSEKEGAAELGLARSSFHQLVVSVYRTFGVRSRGELLSQFVTQPVSDDPVWTGKLMPMGELEHEP